MKTKRLNPNCEYCGKSIQIQQLICIPAPIGTSKGECAECFAQRHNFSAKQTIELIKEMDARKN